MPVNTGLSSTGHGKIRAMQSSLWQTSVALGTASPDQVTANFIKVVKNTAPVVNKAVTLIAPWAMLATAVYQYDLVRRGCNVAQEYMYQSIYASISILGTHRLHSMVLRWMTDYGLDTNGRTLALDSTMQYLRSSRVSFSGGPSRVIHTEPEIDQGDTSDSEDSDDDYSPSLRYIPDVGVYVFYFRGRRMTFERREAPKDTSLRWECGPPDRGHDQETIILSCLSPIAGVAPIKAFLKHVETWYSGTKEDMTSMYLPRTDGYSWDSGVVRPARTLDAVTLDPGVRESIVTDIETYLHPNTKKYYSARGIPWRRGYLFYGPPGTGKSSFTTALAGHFGLDIYMLSLSSKSLNDSKVLALFEMLPRTCIVLLEDIDSAGIQREVMKTRRPATRPRRGPISYGTGPPEDEEEGVTLSGLLNVLDGVRAAEGRILIMTSNTPDNLDEALIRRGRVDQRILFGPASKEVLIRLFEHIFYKSAEEVVGDEAPGDKDEISKLAKTFAASFPERTFTPAEVQGYLLDRRADPGKAISEAVAFFESALETKAK
ncbi:hypothetical protein LTR85_005169 [Meristemomyces frigidus]|nr:hypothetical protein LTR85_005169 [Meristemomyces frigidus]